MGVIVRQGTKQSLVHLVGVMIGIVSTLFIYPLDTHIVGLARFLTDGALFLAPLSLLGLTMVPVRFFPKFRDEKTADNGFFRLMATLTMVIAGVFIMLFIFGKDFLLTLINSRNPEFAEYFDWLLPLTLFAAITTLLYSYSSVFGRIAVPYILTNLLFKFALPFLTLLFVFNLLNQDQFVYGLIIALGVPVVGLLVYLKSIGKLNWVRYNKVLFNSVRKEMLIYAIYGLLGGMGSVMVFKIDSIMISSLRNFSDNGLYSIGANIANVISAPIVALIAISGPIISQSWHNNDLDHIRSIYKDSSLVLLIIGFFALLLVYFCMPDLVSLFPKDKDYSSLYSLTVVLAVAKVFDMAASVNDQIILFSKYYKFHLISMLTLGFVNISLNYYMIAVLDMGILGAALATSISIFIFNLVKFLFIFFKINIQPFSKNTVWLLLLATGVWLILAMIPFTGLSIYNLIIKGILISILYLPAVYYFKISDQFNKFVVNAVELLNSKIR